MLEIYNGRDKFYQWDVNQKLIVDDDIIAVQYDNGTGDALVCGVYEYNGVKVADVPNIMLQTYWAIHAYAYCGECVRGDKVIEVEKRSRPDDYVYTETETLRYSTLYERVKELEEQHIEEVESVAAQLEEANSRIDELEQRPTGGGVKDWNENNPDSPAYIANRTHYEEWGEIEIMPETAADAIVPEEGMAVYINPISVEAGKQYKVWYNGTLYTTTAIDGTAVDTPGVVLGNYGLMMGGTDTGEPFMIAALSAEIAAESGMGIMVGLLDGATSLTLRITTEGIITHKIDDKYINVKVPDWDAELGEPGYIKNRTHYKDKGSKYELSTEFPLALDSFDMGNGITVYKVGAKPISVAAYDEISFSYWDDNGFSHEMTGGSYSQGEGYRHYYHGANPGNTGYISVSDLDEAKLALGMPIPSVGTYLYSNEYTSILLTVPDVVNKIPNEYLDLSAYKKEPQYKLIRTATMTNATTTGDINCIGYNRLLINIYGAVQQVDDDMKLRIYDANNTYITELTMNDIITATGSINQYITIYFEGDFLIFEKDNMAKVAFNPAQRYRMNYGSTRKKEFGNLTIRATNHKFVSSNDFIRVWGAKV